MKRSKLVLGLDVTLLMTVMFIFAETVDLWARAGGGRNRGEGGGFWSFVLLPFALVYVLIRNKKIRKRNEESEKLMQQSALKDSEWDIDLIKARIEESFFKIQQAWVERNQDIAKDCMSGRLYQKHKMQTDMMITNKRKNILNGLNLIEAKIVQLSDYKDNRKDRFWVYIEASAVDYEIDEISGEVTDGDKNKPHAFTELWKFIRTEKGWVVDEIDQKVTLSDLKDFKSISE